jgi:hypothetical protein
MILSSIAVVLLSDPAKTAKDVPNKLIPSLPGALKWKCVEPLIFFLSPANCSGRRADLLFNPRAQFHLARALREAGAPLGDVFSFLSGLYFRGKLTYARAFARPGVDSSGIWIITAGRGLVQADTIVRLEDLLTFRSIPIDVNEPRYREPLLRDALAHSKQLGPGGRAVLLGSIATSKYTSILHEAFGDRLHFPQAFIGRGDFFRGSLLLRCVDEGRELDYSPILTPTRM